MLNRYVDSKKDKILKGQCSYSQKKKFHIWCKTSVKVRLDFNDNFLNKEFKIV